MIKQRESRAGFHAYHHYLDCPWKHYLKYQLQIAPRYTSKHLIYGGVIHEAFNHYYTHDFDMASAIEYFESRLEERKEEYERFTDFQEDLIRGPKMLDAWEVAYGMPDRESFEVLESEREYVLPIGPEFTFTVRPDVVKRHKESNVVYVFDYKSTGYSIPKTIQNADCDDQLTAYIYALSKAHPEWEIGGAYIDVLYNRGSVSEACRSEVIYRDERALMQFELNFAGVIQEITQKVKALGEGYPRHLLFPRNGRICGLFGCEYASICRTDPKEGVIPPGFKRDEWPEEGD
jgi:hypothetical protein